MRKLLLIFMFAFFAFFIQAKHAKAGKSDVSTELCSLSRNEVSVNLVVHGNTHPGKINLRTEIYDKNCLVAIGMRRVDILNLPSHGINISIPLSNKISKKNSYKVLVAIESAKHNIKKKIWKNLKVTAGGTNSFLSKAFKPIPEPFNIRKSIKGIRIRGEMGIL